MKNIKVTHKEIFEKQAEIFGLDAQFEEAKQSDRYMGNCFLIIYEILNDDYFLRVVIQYDDNKGYMNEIHTFFNKFK